MINNNREWYKKGLETSPLKKQAISFCKTKLNFKKIYYFLMYNYK